MFPRNALGWLLVLCSLLAWPGRVNGLVFRDIEFAKVGSQSLKLDLHLPSGAHQPILIVYVHGGAWRAGSKSDMPLGALVERGFPVASVDYRLSTEAQFPAQIHDIKAAIRFLRANTTAHGIDASRIAIIGSSAGGHLAALAGVSSGVKELEGSVGHHPFESSAVQAIVSLYGASNLQTILSQSTPHGLSVRVPALQLLLGGQPREKPELARLASPVAHIDAGDPPLLLIHGDADPQMPYEQSVELQRAYDGAKVRVRLETVAGGKHGGPEFHDAERTTLMAEFLSAAAQAPLPQSLPAR